MQESQTGTNTFPKLSTVNNLPSFFPAVGLTVAAVHGQIFKSQDRIDSKGRKIPGNGLAATGAIIRRGRKVLIDVDKYAAWLSGGFDATKYMEEKVKVVEKVQDKVADRIKAVERTRGV